jgi:hypothetical protein
MDNARELASRLLDLLRREHAAMAAFLVALAAFDERRLWAELCPAEAAPHRTVVTAFAMPALAEVVRASVEGVQPVELRPARFSSPCLQEPAIAASKAGLAPMAVQPVAPRTGAEPLTADLRRLHVTVSKRFMEKLTAARDALSHSHPGADAEAILEAGLDLLIERHMKRRGIVARPRTENAPSPSLTSTDAGERGVTRDTAADASESGDLLRSERAESRHICAAVKRAVWLRDGGRCRFRLENGELCGSTHRLQFDHVRPIAMRGGSTEDNLRLACSAHNLLAARRVFGDALMRRYAPARTGGTPSQAR